MYKRVFQNQDVVLIRTDNKGLCVVAARDFQKKETVFIVPYVADFIENLNKTQLKDYYLVDNPNSTTGYIAFGLCSFVNHCIKKQNLNYIFDYKNKTISFYTTKKVKKGQELLIDYRYNENEKIEFEEQAPLFLDVS